MDDAERGFGAWHFLRTAGRDQQLAGSRYLGLIASFLQRPEPLYPGSALLAMSALGPDARYLFCDLDGASTANLQSWADRVGAHRREIAQADGMATTARWLDTVGRARALVHVDPFDPHAKAKTGVLPLTWPRTWSTRPPPRLLVRL